MDQNREVQEGRLRSIQTNDLLSKNEKGCTKPMIGHTTQGQTNTGSLIGRGLRQFFPQVGLSMSFVERKRARWAHFGACGVEGCSQKLLQ